MTEVITKPKAVNLYGLLGLEKVEPRKPPKEFKQLVNDIDELHKAEAMLLKVGTASSAAAAKEEMRKKATKLVLELRRTAWEEVGIIPKELDFLGYDAKLEAIKDRDPVSRMSSTYHMTLADLRQLVSDLGFVIIPLDYLSPLSGHTKKAISSPIEAFKADAKELSMTVHVMTPTAYYGVAEHARSEDPNQPCFDGRNVEAMYLARQNAAAFRDLFRDVGGLQTEVARLTKELLETRDRVNKIGRKVDDHTDDIQRLWQEIHKWRSQERAQREAALQEANRYREEVKSLRGQLAVMATRAANAVLDPMVFALRKGVDLREGEGRVYIGPCWGPDFDIAVAEARSKGMFDPSVQAQNITERVNSLWK
ncbi:MAG: hypothetical protein RIQ56_540 [Candidatus Parcubacteria bacterium]|jgi:hypothetical protein